MTTTAVDEAKRNALVEEMLARAKAAPEPGASESRVVHEGDEETPPAVVHEVMSPGYIVLYNVKTGEPSVMNLNMARWKLRNDRFPAAEGRQWAGKHVWTADDPGFRPPQGKLRCYLHNEGKYRNLADDMGIARDLCKRENLRSESDIEAHMRVYHPSEWRGIQRHIEMEREDRARERDEMLAQALMALAGRGTATATTETPTRAAPATSVTVSCEDCDETFDGVNRMVALNKVKAHQRKEHGDGS